MADFGKSWKSLKTLLNASKTLLKWFLTPCATVCVDFGWETLRKGRKFADFEQKAWAITHGFEHGRFWKVLEIASNSLKRFQNPPKMISNSLRDCLCRFGVNSEGSKFLKRFQFLLKWFLTPCATVCVDFGWIRKGRNFADFELSIAHGFEHGRFWAKSLGYSPWFWTWPILASPGNRFKLSETLPKPF